jgi:hypothetical protein
MVIENLFMKFIYVIISHVIFFFQSFSHIIHLYFVPWPMIDNSTSYDMIMYSTLMCFHPSMLVVSAIFPIGGSKIKTCDVKQNVCAEHW